jgi:hypothetical protein
VHGSFVYAIEDSLHFPNKRYIAKNKMQKNILSFFPAILTVDCNKKLAISFGMLTATVLFKGGLSPEKNELTKNIKRTVH